MKGFSVYAAITICLLFSQTVKATWKNVFDVETANTFNKNAKISACTLECGDTNLFGKEIKFNIANDFVRKLARQNAFPQINFMDNTFVFCVIPATAQTNFNNEQFVFMVFDAKKENLVQIYNKDLTEELGIVDPIEGFNRVMYVINHALAMYLAKPLLMTYSSILPRCIMDCFNRLTDNLEVLVKGFSCLLQARFEAAGEVGLSFLINTTIGIAGLFDPATHWFDIKKHQEDFGQAFASWGIGAGCYLFLPVQGPTSIRDAIGLIFDYALDPKSYFYGGQWFAKINRASVSFNEYERINDSQSDPYVFIRDVWFSVRNIQIKVKE